MIPPRPIPGQLSGKRSKRRDAGIARAVIAMAGSPGNVLRLHTRACELVPDDDDSCTCMPVVLVFGALA